MEFLSKITFFLHPGKLAVVSFPKASAKLHGLCELTKFFRKKFLEKFRRLSRKLCYAPYSHGFKAHKIFHPKAPFLFLLKADWCRPDGTQTQIYAFHTDRPNFLAGFLRVYALKHKKHMKYLRLRREKKA